MKRKIMCWKYTFRLLGRILHDTIFLGLAVFALFLFVMMWLSPDGTIWLGEPNIIIRVIETVFCIGLVVWAARRIITKLQQARRHKRSGRLSKYEA